MNVVDMWSATTFNGIRRLHVLFGLNTNSDEKVSMYDLAHIDHSNNTACYGYANEIS